MSNGGDPKEYNVTLNAGQSIYTKTYLVYDSNSGVIEYEISIDSAKKAD